MRRRIFRLHPLGTEETSIDSPKRWCQDLASAVEQQDKCRGGNGVGNLGLFTVWLQEKAWKTDEHRGAVSDAICLVEPT